MVDVQLVEPAGPLLQLAPVGDAEGHAVEPGPVLAEPLGRCRRAVLVESPRPTGGWRPPPQLLRDALGQLRLDGAIVFRSELSEAFEFESTPLALAEALRPGAERLTRFHIVAQGSYWVAVSGGERHWASEGDVIVSTRCRGTSCR